MHLPPAKKNTSVRTKNHHPQGDIESNRNEKMMKRGERPAILTVVSPIKSCPVLETTTLVLLRVPLICWNTTLPPRPSPAPRGCLAPPDSVLVYRIVYRIVYRKVQQEFIDATERERGRGVFQTSQSATELMVDENRGRRKGLRRGTQQTNR